MVMWQTAEAPSTKCLLMWKLNEINSSQIALTYSSDTAESDAKCCLDRRPSNVMLLRNNVAAINLENSMI